MINNLVECKLSDLGEIVGGATPSTKNLDNYEQGNIPWITPKDLSNFYGRYISNGERNITEIGYKSCSTQMLPKNSILFSSRAPIGYLAIASNELCTNQGFKSIIPNEKVDYLYLYYLLKYKKNEIESLAVGSTFKEVSSTIMKNIIVRIHCSIDEQKRISSILSTIDDKIELNNKINKNLCYILDKSISPFNNLGNKVFNSIDNCSFWYPFVKIFLNIDWHCSSNFKIKSIGGIIISSLVKKPPKSRFLMPVVPFS